MVVSGIGMTIVVQVRKIVYNTEDIQSFLIVTLTYILYIYNVIFPSDSPRKVDAYLRDRVPQRGTYSFILLTKKCGKLFWQG